VKPARACGKFGPSPRALPTGRGARQRRRSAAAHASAKRTVKSMHKPVLRFGQLARFGLLLSRFSDFPLSGNPPRSGIACHGRTQADADMLGRRPLGGDVHALQSSTLLPVAELQLFRSSPVHRTAPGRSGGGLNGCTRARPRSHRATRYAPHRALGARLLSRIWAEAVRRQAALERAVIDPRHFAAAIAGFRLCMDGAVAIIHRGAIFEARVMPSIVEAD
jgi:hypothetical protein